MIRVSRQRPQYRRILTEHDHFDSLCCGGGRHFDCRILDVLVSSQAECHWIYGVSACVSHHAENVSEFYEDNARFTTPYRVCSEYRNLDGLVRPDYPHLGVCCRSLACLP